MTLRIVIVLFAAAFATTGMVNGCKDTGSNPLPRPEITKVEPDSGAVGDTIKIEGRNFGDSRGGSDVHFGSVVASDYREWRNDEIKVRVPGGVQSGLLQVTIRTEGGESNGVKFKVLGQTWGGISFAGQIQPILNAGCVNRGCHPGGGAPFSLESSVSYNNLVNIPATVGPCANRLLRVKPNSADSSALYLRVSGSTCGLQMPLSGNLLSTTDINLIRDWINQGAQNN